MIGEIENFQDLDKVDKQSLYGYFFNLEEPNEGDYILIPQDKSAETRARVFAEGKYDLCALYIFSDGVKYEKYHSDEEGDLVFDKTGNYTFFYNRDKNEFLKGVLGIGYFKDASEFSMRYAHRFDVIKTKLNEKYRVDIKLSKNEGRLNYIISAIDADGHRTEVSDENLLIGLVELFDSVENGYEHN